MHKKILLPILLLLLTGVLFAKSGKPLWCNGARSYVEEHICRNPDLYSLDASLMKSYGNAKAGKNTREQKSIKNSQRQWIKERARSCKGRGDSCIARFYRERISILDSMASSTDAPIRRDKSIEGKLKNMTYDDVNGERIPLVNGEYARGQGMDTVTVSFLGIYGTGDLNANGKEDYAVLLMGDGYGSGRFFYLAVVMQTKNGLHVIPHTYYLGDRVGVGSGKIQEGKIIVPMTEHGSNDPACCPSKKVIRYYKVSRGRIVKLR